MIFVKLDGKLNLVVVENLSKLKFQGNLLEVKLENRNLVFVELNFLRRRSGKKGFNCEKKTKNEFVLVFEGLQ